MRLFILLMLISGSANAISVQGLIDKYGKSVIVELITNKTSGNITIIIEDEVREAHKPSMKYVNARSISIDFKKTGLSANKIDNDFIEKKRKEDQFLADREAQLAILEHQRKIDLAQKVEMEHKRAEEERNRPRDKYDLAVEEAANKGRMLDAYNKHLEIQLSAIKKKSESVTNNNYNSGASSPSRSMQSSSINPVCNIPIKKAVDDLKQVYAKKYPNSFSTQKMLIDGNIDSYNDLCRQKIPSELLGALNNRIRKYYPHFSTIKTLYSGDEKAYTKLQSY